MEFNVQKEYIQLHKTDFRGRSEQSIDCDVTLPEYLPDIMRIVRCSCVPGVRSHQVNGDRITAECTCALRVLYMNEQGALFCYEQNIQFTKQLEVNSEDTREFFVGAKADYMNYRVSGQRRFELHGAVTIFAKACDSRKYEVITDAYGDGITLKSEKTTVSNLKCVVEKPFTITETCDAGALSEPIGTIIACSSAAVIHQVKIISNKVFLKGELIIHSAFTGAESQQVQTLENVLAINQIIEAPDITEECHIDSSLTVTDLEIKPRFDLSGNKNLLDITACVNFSGYSFENSEISLVKEAYSVTYETDVKKSIVYTTAITEEIENTFLCRGVADLSTTGIEAVLSFMCNDITSGFSVQENNCIITGELSIEIIYRDMKGEICFAQRHIPYEYTMPIPENDGILTCNPHCTLCAISYVINSDDRLDIRAEINVRGVIFCEKELSAITDLAVNKDKIKSTDTASLTIYFANKGEALWNIAEKYNTTVERIVKENALTETTVKENCKLLIPKM